MAGQADGRILVDSAIDPQGFEVGAKQLRTAVKSLSGKVESLGGTFKKALGGNPRALEAYRARAEELEQTVARLGADMEQLGAKPVFRDAYKDLVAETETAGAALEKLLNKRAKLDNRGTSQSSQTYKNLQADIAAVSAEYDRLLAKKARMEADGKAMTSGTETAEYQSMAAAIDAARARLDEMRTQIEQARSQMVSLTYTRSLWTDLAGSMGTAMGAVRSGIESAMQKSQGFATVVRSIQYAWNTVGGVIRKTVVGALSGALSIVKGIGSAVGRVASGVVSLAKTVAKKLLSAFKSVAATVKKLFTGHKSLTGSVGSLTSSLKKLIPAMLAARGVMGILRKGVNAFLEANQQVKSQLEACWNGLGNVLGPIITKIVNLVTIAISYVTAFLRLLGFGASGGSGSGTAKIATMGKAVAGVGGAAKIATVQTDAFGKKSAVAIASVGGAATAAADEIHTVGDAAESTAKKIQNLSGLDQLNTWKSEQDTGGGGGGGGGGGAVGDVGVTLPEVELPDWAKLLAEQLRSGAWEEAARTLSAKLNEMVDGVDWPSLGDRLGEKVAGVLKFLATFIREFDFADLFTGLFTALKNALEKIDAEDIGALLAARFVLIFSALQGAVESDVIPTAIEKLGGAIEGFFSTVREKFRDESDPAHGGWYVVGQNLGAVIGQIVNAIAGLLSGTDWNQIVGDIGEFWGGLWNALNEGANAPDWEGLFHALKIACKRLVVRLLQWLPQKSESRKTWDELEARLEKDGDSVGWGEIFNALWDTLMGLVDALIEHIPSRAELKVYVDELKDKLAQALDYADWDEMTAAFADTLKNTIEPAIESFLDYLYEQMKASHPIIAGWLFPGRDAISGAVQNLKGYLQAGSLDAAQSQIRAMIYNGQLTAEEAERIAAECGYAYADGMLTALPAVESASDEVVSAAAVSMEEATETYSYELQEGGAGAARAYLDGLIAEGAVSYEQAAQIATNAADGMAAQGSQFAAAAQTLADEYIGKLQGKVPEASAAGRALGDASAGAAKGVSESGTDIGAAAEGAAAAVPTAIDGQQQPAYDAGVTVGEQATSGVESGLSGFEDTVTDTMDGAAKGGANSAKRMRRDVSKHTRQLRGDVSEDFEGMGEDMADSFSGSRTKVDADAKSMAATMKTQLNSMKSTISSVLSAMKSTATSNMTTIKKACSLENISSSLSAEMKAATVVISSQ